MENKIVKKKLFPTSEELYEDYIRETIEELKKYSDIRLTSKILHYLKRPSFYFYCTVIEQTNSNPFDFNIEFCFEFIDGEIPYVTLISNFFESAMNDNKNYYRCLTKEHNYKFSLDILKEQKSILESMIKGIGNFLTFIKETIEINTFIFFGEYEYNHIYQINDFLQNKNFLNFYRINDLINNKLEERYIIFTKLYFLLFEPLEEDKSLIKLLFYYKLKDINLNFDKNEIRDSLILQISENKYKENIEFILIDRKKSIKKPEEINTDEKNEIKKKEKYNYSILIKEWFTYIDSNNFNKYELVLDEYKMLFSEYRGKLVNENIDQKQIDEYNKYIEFYEKLITYYENKKDKNNNERIHKFIAEIIYICSELVNYAQNKKWKENEYLLKVKKYINSYK